MEEVKPGFTICELSAARLQHLQQADYNEYCKELWFTITYNKYIDKRQ